MIRTNRPKVWHLAKVLYPDDEHYPASEDIRPDELVVQWYDSTQHTMNPLHRKYWPSWLDPDDCDHNTLSYRVGQHWQPTWDAVKRDVIFLAGIKLNKKLHTLPASAMAKLSKL